MQHLHGKHHLRVGGNLLKKKGLGSLSLTVGGSLSGGSLSGGSLTGDFKSKVTRTIKPLVYKLG